LPLRMAAVDRGSRPFWHGSGHVRLASAVVALWRSRWVAPRG
jgi:hypothetical protein